MHGIDVVVGVYIAGIRTPGVTEFMYILSTFFDVTWQSLLVTVCGAGLVSAARGMKYAVLFLLSLASGALLVSLLKYVLNVTRPVDAVMTAFGQSFPSYHAAIATIFFVMLIFIFDDYLSGVERRLFNFFCIASIFLVSFSRVYLGVHWVSDVVGGVILGALFAYFCTEMFRGITHE